METMINDLYFDKEMVSTLEKKKVDIDILYVYLMNGKITLQEYLYLCGVKQAIVVGLQLCCDAFGKRWANPALTVLRY